MKEWINNFDELTDYQKQHAKDQYVWLRSWEEQISEEEYINNLMNESEYENIDEELDEILRCKEIEIDTEDEFYIYVDL